MVKLWTAQGFLSDVLSKYIKNLVDTLPENLSVVYLVNSGYVITPIQSHVVAGLDSKFIFLFRSEANDLALRLARQYTRKEDIVAMEE